jgi:hypothetical protein
MKCTQTSENTIDISACDLIPGDVVVGYFIDSEHPGDALLVQSGPQMVISILTEENVDGMKWIDITTLDTSNSVHTRFYSYKCPFRIYER